MRSLAVFFLFFFKLNQRSISPLVFPGISLVKNLPAKQEMQVWSLGREDPLEKEMATHSSILAWRIPWIEEPGGLQSMGSQSRTRLKRLVRHAPSMHGACLQGWVCWGLRGEGWVVGQSGSPCGVGEDIQREGGPWVPRVAPGLQN